VAVFILYNNHIAKKTFHPWFFYINLRLFLDTFVTKDIINLLQKWNEDVFNE